MPVACCDGCCCTKINSSNNHPKKSIETYLVRTHFFTAKIMIKMWIFVEKITEIAGFVKKHRLSIAVHF
jgi:hypothetical protein